MVSMRFLERKTRIYPPSYFHKKHLRTQTQLSANNLSIWAKMGEGNREIERDADITHRPLSLFNITNSTIRHYHIKSSIYPCHPPLTTHHPPPPPYSPRSSPPRPPLPLNNMRIPLRQRHIPRIHRVLPVPPPTLILLSLVPPLLLRPLPLRLLPSHMG